MIVPLTIKNRISLAFEISLNSDIFLGDCAMVFPFVGDDFIPENTYIRKKNINWNLFPDFGSILAYH